MYIGLIEYYVTVRAKMQVLVLYSICKKVVLVDP